MAATVKFAPAKKSTLSPLDVVLKAMNMDYEGIHAQITLVYICIFVYITLLPYSNKPCV